MFGQRGRQRGEGPPHERRVQAPGPIATQAQVSLGNTRGQTTADTWCGTKPSFDLRVAGSPRGQRKGGSRRRGHGRKSARQASPPLPGQGTYSARRTK